MKPLLDWIDFGKISAERDDLLSEYFYDAGVLSSVIKSNTSFLILGRKGAGKTAVFRYFSENTSRFISDNNSLAISLSLQDYSWSAHEALANPTKATSLAFLQSWKFVIYVQAITAIKKKYEQNKERPPKSITSCARLVEKIYQNPYPTIGQVIGNKILSLSKLRLPGGGVNLEDGDLDEISIEAGELEFSDLSGDNSLIANLSRNIETITLIFESSIKNTPNLPTVFVCFDRVDEAWDEESIDSSKRLIAGLVSASESITSRLGGKIRPIVFLREDIFEELSLNDKNKLKADCGRLLAWQRDSLFRVILERVQYFAKSNGIVPAVSDIDSLFDKDKMRQGMAPSDYILRRTMMRPRDLIRILQTVTEDMAGRRDDPFGGDPVSTEKLECSSIYNAEATYSEWLRGEIVDEWRAQRPDITNYLNAIQNVGSTIVTRESLTNSLSNLGIKLTEAQVTEVIRFLFENSLIGLKVGKSQQWRFKCFQPMQGFIEADEYKVHDGLVRALNLREPRNANQDPS
ncbi:P-loop ATPase, Sll1717 family [Shinella zoogloeoides]|uniref:P-loop ATPase, Sll1717 family n=1 Tax=Shinella zoogloeoides TaxID=352475 RepID=UPI00273DC9E3|nr:hypothetical protein [Shinella zoogloeoides]WLR94564.1 hypothetical protein Q9316_10495 [Shinella zoogloeoides]